MLLAADIGNAQIKIGIFQENDLIYSFRLTSKTRRTSDEFGITMQMFLKNSGIEAAEIQAAIIASVVPDVMHAFVNALKKYFQIETMIVGPGIKTGLKIGAENPKEVGAEMIAAAVAANHYYASPSIVIDFSTTTTYQYIDADQKFEAAVICPGIRTMADALVQSTARLPEIEIRKPKSILGRNHQLYSGGHRLRQHRPDGVYRAENERGIRRAECLRHRHRRHRAADCRRNRLHRLL